MVLSQWHDGQTDAKSGVDKLAFGFLSVSLANLSHHLSILSSYPIYVFKDNVKLIDGYCFGGQRVWIGSNVKLHPMTLGKFLKGPFS